MILFIVVIFLNFSFAHVGKNIAVADFNQKKAVAYYNKGCRLDDEKKYELALVEYEKALQISPKMYQAHVNKASALESLGRYEEAAIAIKEGLHLNPKNEIGWDVSARIHHSMKKFDQVVRDSDRCLKIVPALNCFLRKGNAFEKMKMYKDARKAYEQGLRFHPKNQDLLSNRTLMSFKLLDIESIEKNLGEYRKYYPTDQMVYLYEGALKELRAKQGNLPGQ